MRSLHKGGIGRIVVAALSARYSAATLRKLELHVAQGGQLLVDFTFS